MRRKSIIILLMLTILSTGCWNQRELSDLAIAMALGIDKANNEEIRLTIQVVMPQEVAEPSYYTPVTVYSTNAITVFEGFRKMTTMSPRKIYLPHFRIMVISEELARNGIKDILDMLIRDHEFRSDFYIVIAKDGYSAEDVLEIMTPFERIPANELFSALETSIAAWAPTVGILLDELITDIETKGKEAVLTGLTIKGEPTKYSKSENNVKTLDNYSVLQIEEVGVFKGDSLIGWLSHDESKGYNYISENIQNTVGRIDCPGGGQLVVEVKGSEADIKPYIENGNPRIEINIKTTANVGEVPCRINLHDPKTIKQLENNMEERVKELVQLSINSAQKKYNSDIFGFGNIIRKSYPQEWRKLESKWDEEFKKLPVSINIEGIIDFTGTVDQSFFK